MTPAPAGLVGRPGGRLTEITDAVRTAGATAEPIPCDLASLAQVRAAATAARDLLAMGAVRPMKASGVAYANAKLAILYYAHELQRRVGDGIGVAVFEPGWMPGTGLGREASPALQAMGRALTHLPGTTTPARSGPALASLVLDDRWVHLRDGAFVVVDKEAGVLAHGHDRARERRLWEATGELLDEATNRQKA